jgi:hypothetical protein
VSALWSAAKNLGRFWYDFIVGDDWLVAAGVAVGLAVTYGLHRVSDVPAWWFLPLAAVVLLATSLWRANRRDARRGT